MSDPLALARSAAVFSTVTLSELAQRQTGSTSSRLRAFIGQRSESDSNATLGQVFDNAFGEIASAYKSEYVYKNTLISKIVFGRHSPRTCAAMLEVPMGHSLADVVILNGTMTTYEIKTDLDGFRRLASQLEDYRSRSEHVYVVTSDSRACAVEHGLPDGVGLIALRSSGSLSILRPSESNSARLNADHLFLLLRTDEARRVARRMTGNDIDDPVGRAWPKLRVLLGQTDPFELHNEVLRELRSRQMKVAALVGHKDFPTSLRALAYSTDLSSLESSRLLSRLDSMPSQVLAELH